MDPIVFNFFLLEEACNYQDNLLPKKTCESDVLSVLVEVATVSVLVVPVVMAVQKQEL